MRRNRRTREGLSLQELKGRGAQVYLRGLPFPVWATRYRYPLPGGGWTWRYVVARFGQRTALGVHRFLVLSLLAYLLAHWVKLIPGKEGLAWREAGREVVRFLLPEMVLRVLLEELQRLGLWPPPSGRGGCLCGVLGRCKF
ncbi:hypothetical protein Mgrana_02466 [Meiothermus granaticius NBRC 107808]|uniref:Transposase n=1 Tax=Meiothermus granaticius NBRC 107808 TaxID=1227551 RepID=A0A399F7L5_9DEIN|nr:hypothetical protein [Meiothermus granaticius]RIH91656.1 hypothetical protein Mgrana_02466 [Meiothermus granaticius NBRC 107808]